MNQEANQMMMFNAAAVLLPLIPAILLFKFLPASGEIEGPFKGLRIKFGGAFAAYLVLFLVMWEGRPPDLHHYHTWTVKGIVQLRNTGQGQEPSIREVICRIIPPKFEVENDGSFNFEIPVPDDDQGMPQYPDLQIDLRNYAGVTVHVAGGRTPGYGAPIIPLKFDELKRTIDLASPVLLYSAGLQPPYTAQSAETPQPGGAVPPSR
jgi:hypothetical protein